MVNISWDYETVKHDFIYTENSKNDISQQYTRDCGRKYTYFDFFSSRIYGQQV